MTFDTSKALIMFLLELLSENDLELEVHDRRSSV